MVVVSGGGWGVGDIAGAVREFIRVPEVEQHRRASPGATSSSPRSCAQAFADEPRVHVLRVHRQDARAARGGRRARALHRRRHLPGGEGRGHAGRLLRAARRPRAPEHPRDGRRSTCCGWPTTPTSCASTCGRASSTRPERARAPHAGAARRRGAPRPSTSCCRRPRRVRPIPLLAPAHWSRSRPSWRCCSASARG